MEAHEFEYGDLHFIAREVTDKIIKKLEDDQKWAEKNKNEAAVNIAEKRADPDPGDIMSFEYHKGRQKAFEEAERYISEMKQNIASELLKKYKEAHDKAEKAKKTEEH
jgi:hypothetical protein